MDRIPIKASNLFFCSALYLCLLLPEMPSNVAKGNRLTSSAQEKFFSGQETVIKVEAITVAQKMRRSKGEARN